MGWFMMAKIFVDTSFILPIFKRNDANSEKIQKNKHILLENECYISNGVLQETITVIMKKTKSIELSKMAYYFLVDNFTIINEFDIERYNDRVFTVFKKYNANTYKASYIDCSCVVIANMFDLDYVVSLNKFFKKFEEIKLLELD